MVIQNVRQLRMQKTAIGFVSRSAVRSRDSSALQPEFQNLVEGLDLPAHRIPVEFLACLGTGTHRQVGDQVPFDTGAPGRRIALLRVKNC
jgi:hypothetical protein